MIKRSSVAPILLVIAVWLVAGVSAQVRPRANRILNEASVESGAAGSPQLGQRRLPRDGVNRPLPGAQGNRQPGANQIKKQRLRQMVMQRLGLTADQRMRMQEIRRSHEDEAITTGRRLRQARAALDRAIMNENFNEEVVRRATEELAAAQVDKIRLESRIRSQVRGVLTLEQVQEFNRLERELRREMQQQKREMQERQMGAADPVSPPRPTLEADDLDLVGLLLFEN